MNGAKEFITMAQIIDPDKQIYIERPEDEEILQAFNRREYVILLGARQTGKTSLLYKLAGEFKTEIRVFVDLSVFSELKGADWYDNVAKEVVGNLPNEDLKKQIEVPACANSAQILSLLKMIAEKTDKDRFILMLDEIGTIPDEIRDYFFGAIRTTYIRRERDFQKHIFVLSGATPPAELISPESENSPFNISRIIYMSDFNLDGVKELGKNLRFYGFTIDDSVIEHIYDWTHGHPNLTQEIFARLVKGEKSEKITKEIVDDSVKKLIAEGCNNLNHIQRRLQDEVVKQRVLGILNGELEIPFSLSNPEVLKLYLMGVIGEGTKGECVIRNGVYAKALRSKSSLITNIKSNPHIYVPLIAISRIEPQSRTISRIKKEVDTLRPQLESQIPDIRYKIPSDQEQLSSALEELVQLGVIYKDGERYILTEEGTKVLDEI